MEGRESGSLSGVEFKIKGRFHFGWAVHRQATKNDFTAIWIGYAYETIPGKATCAARRKGGVTTVYPASLGHLAPGASAIQLRAQETHNC